ncbi:ABC transporter substrate-binding protein [Deinococcus cellulosilyticus]|uniref:Bicyclomycin resistance protein n=1 Tax=Deinococcus cellulosilyticus (strain DSM 18568 / NBRC 106333 / KACC 11606 / 5516J-15) TaxID=1223518 RepID=A0A511N290_DEIC1|nr:sugar ABC transporter substrate-binding protein [Deinococcus cellulosilyticus]GEM46578.1 bicyclomycin resistance protein [Deinococcus cellulosilyticus NBRC 106333 = KACC 11606]
MKASAVKLIALSATLLGTAALATDVKVVIPYYSAATEPFFKKMEAGYEKAHPGVDIKLEIVNWDNLYDKLTTDIAGGTAPDISIIGTRWLTDFVKNDIVEPLDGYMSATVKGGFIDAFLEPGKLQGKIYGLPVAASARAMYYNKDVLAKAGVKNPPRTWTELQSVCKKIVAANIKDTYCFGLQGKEVETDAYWYYALWSYGGDVVSGGKSGVNSAAAVKAANLYKSLITNKYTQPGVTGYSRENVQDLFKQGRLGFVITAPFLIGQIAKEAPKLNYGITAIPKGTKQATYGVTDSIALFKTSRVKKEAFDFMAYVLDARQHIEFTKNEGFLPIAKGEASDPYFTNNAQLKIFTNLLPVAKFAPNIADWEKVADATSRALQSIYLGQKDVKAALNGAASEANQVIK